jgi:hypothetical protein
VLWSHDLFHSPSLALPSGADLRQISWPSTFTPLSTRGNPPTDQQLDFIRSSACLSTQPCSSSHQPASQPAVYTRFSVFSTSTGMEGLHPPPVVFYVKTSLLTPPQRTNARTHALIPSIQTQFYNALQICFLKNPLLSRKSISHNLCYRLIR